MSFNIESHVRESDTPDPSAESRPSTPQSDITNFHDALSEVSTRRSDAVHSQDPERQTPSVASRPSSAEQPHHTENAPVSPEPKAKPTKSKSDKAKDFGDKFDKILKPLTVPLGSLTQIASLVTFIQAQEAKDKASSGSSNGSSVKDTETSGGASGTDASGTTGQLSDPAAIPSQQTS